MSPVFYQFLHDVGAFVLFFGLGVLCASPGAKNKLGSALHGIGLLTLLVSGFGYLGKTHQMSGMPKFVYVMIAFFLVLSFVPMLMKKGVLPRGVGAFVVLLSGAILAYVGYFKPF